MHAHAVRAWPRAAARARARAAPRRTFVDARGLVGMLVALWGSLLASLVGAWSIPCASDQDCVALKNDDVHEPQQDPASRRELSFWVHCTLPKGSWKRGYWETARSAAPAKAASSDEVHRAARILTETYHANTLYLLYHEEVDWTVAEPLFQAWHASVHEDIELVPTLLFRTYNASQGVAPFGGSLNFDAARSNNSLNTSEIST